MSGIEVAFNQMFLKELVHCANGKALQSEWRSFSSWFLAAPLGKKGFFLCMCNLIYFIVVYNIAE